MTTAELRQIATEAEELGQFLLNFADRLRDRTAVSEHPRMFWPKSQDGLRRMVADHLALRQRRAIHIGDDLFGEPAWDMLLGLLKADLDRIVLGLDQVSSFAGVKQETARRWLVILHDRGLVEVFGQDRRGKPMMVRLTSFGIIKMTKLLVEQQEMLIQAGRLADMGASQVEI